MPKNSNFNKTYYCLKCRNINNSKITQKEKKSPHQELYFYYRQNELHAVRSGDWKLYFPRTYRSLNGRQGGKDGMPVKYEYNQVKSIELYNLIDDPRELSNVYSENMEIAKKLEEIGERARNELGDKLTSREGVGVREIGMID